MINRTTPHSKSDGGQPAKTASPKDWNVCEHCNLYIPIHEHRCPNCEQPMITDSRCKISIWRLGEIRDGVLGHLANGLKRAFGADVVIQPAFLDERLSERPHWRGISSTVFLNQVHRRHKPETFICLGVTEKNIVPDANYNFLFGYAYMGLPASVVSLHPLAVDEPSSDRLLQRLLLIATHEIGHNLGLDHHAYDDRVDCVMVGDAEVDSLETVDSGTSDFCPECADSISGALANL